MYEFNFPFNSPPANVIPSLPFHRFASKLNLDPSTPQQSSPGTVPPPRIQQPPPPPPAAPPAPPVSSSGGPVQFTSGPSAGVMYTTNPYSDPGYLQMALGAYLAPSATGYKTVDPYFLSQGMCERVICFSR